MDLIKCSYTEVWPIEKIIPNDKNANTHPQSQVDLLAKLMINNGIRHPIVISKRSGKIVFGHCRRLSAIKNGWTSFPIDLQDFASEAEELQAMIADNTIQEFSETDHDLVKSILLEFPDINFEMLAMPDLFLNITKVDTQEIDLPQDKKPQECPSCGHQW